MYTEHNYNNELYHHGIKGMKWGVRRFQNVDGSYTGAGKRRYGYISDDDRVPYAKKHRVLRGVRSAYKRTPEEKEYGAKEDARAYKYNKPGESGWKGAARAAGAKIKPKASRQLASAKRYSQRHSTAGIVVRQAGKSVLQGMGVGLAATPVYMLAGPAAPVVAVGASVVGGILSANNLAKAGTSIGYKYGLDKKIKIKG